MKPTDTMRCQFYSCSLKAYHCVQRQTDVRSWNNGATRFKYVPAHLIHCASGKCEQGRGVREALRGQTIPVVPVKRGPNMIVGKRVDNGRQSSRWDKKRRDGVGLPGQGAKR